MNQFVLRPLFVFLFFHMVMVSSVSAQFGFFEKRFGGAGVQVAQSAVQGIDGAIYLFGYADNGSVGDYDMCLMKISAAGDSIWTRYYGTSRLEFGNAIDNYGTDRLVLIGTTEDSIFQNGEDVMMLLVDTAGSEIWRKVYGGPGSQGCRWVETTTDSGFIFCGFTPDVFGSNDAWVVRTDASGNILWSASPPGVENDVAMRVIGLTDSTWVITGDTKSAGNGNYDVRITGFNTSGQIIFDHIQSDTLTNGCQGMMKTSAGTLVSFGETEVYPGSFFDFQFQEFDTIGNFIRSQHFGGSGADALFDMVECDNGDWLGTGYSNSQSGGALPIDLALVRLDSLGNLLWSRNYGGSGIDLGYKLIKAIGGGYYAAGRSTGQDEDFYLVYFGEDGLLGWPENISSDRVELKVIPNPASLRVTASNLSGITAWEIADVAGSSVKRGEALGLLSIDLDISELNAGCYFFKSISPSGKSQYSRFVIHR